MTVLRPARLALVLSAGLAAAAPAARAGNAPEDAAFQARLFGAALGKSRAHACFTRVYDAEHLAGHPQQNVRTMTLLVTGDPGEANGPTYALSLGMTFRRSGTHFETSGNCGALHDTAGTKDKGAVVHCGVDCDGGSIDVTLKDDTAVLVAIPDGARIWTAKDGDAEGDDQRRRFGADDKLFRLDRTRPADCLPLATEEDRPLLRRGL